MPSLSLSSSWCSSSFSSSLSPSCNMKQLWWSKIFHGCDYKSSWYIVDINNHYKKN
jgi:hypothetical protein